MRVVNAMFGRGRGGLEESFVIYHVALCAGGHEVVSLVDRRAAVLEDVTALSVSVRTLNLWSKWDPISVWKVRSSLAGIRPDVVVTHGNRAGRITLRAARRRWPVVARLPNYSFRRVLNADGFIAMLPDQVEALVRSGVAPGRIFHIPSMLAQLPPRREFSAPGTLVVGAMGRFVKIKGFEVLLHALAWLRQHGQDFQAVLAGDGEQRSVLMSLTVSLGLDSKVKFPGWVRDKRGFFQGVTVLALPSLEEAFSRVMLEAMAHEIPVVVTDAPGPRQIVKHEQTGLVVPRGDAVALGRALQRLLVDKALATRIAAAARAEVERHYTVEANAPRLTAALTAVVERFRAAQTALTPNRSHVS